MIGEIALIAAAAFAASIISGFGGFGGAFIIVIVLTPIVGPKAVVPLISVFAVCSNVSRVYVYRESIEWRLAIQFTLASLPGVFVGAQFLAWVPENAMFTILGVTLILALPLRRYLKQHQFSPGLGTMIAFGLVFGVVSGATAGSGMLAVAGLVSFGLQGPVLLGTDAAIGIVNASARAITYWSLGLLDRDLIIAGLLMGLVTFPGTWVASRLVRAMGDKKHTLIIEIIIVSGGVWMLYNAWAG